ncbi:MAG: ADP-ribosylglycohydrolase family protein [Armatimonadota bacterium]
MMTMMPLEERIKGCLLGAAIGAELGYSRLTNPERFTQAAEVFQVDLQPATTEELPGRVNARRVTPFINLGVQAYLAQGGRVSPEGFASLLKDDNAIAGPVFSWDIIHSIQEILKEGMHPRISGHGAAPCGLIAAAMPAVGIYHFGDPEYAYLDGVELASVAQPRLGADWAALCASAIAAAFDADATPTSIIDIVLKIAHQNNKELFYQLNEPMGYVEWQLAEEATFLNWWMTAGGCGTSLKGEHWIASNPIRFVLPLLKRYADDPHKLMALIVSPQPASWFDGMIGGHPVSAVIAGAISGALHGADIFPAEWRTWAEPVAAPWYAIQEVVHTRLQKEREIITVTERAAAPRQGEISLLHDKVYGCILAGAIGNAMGSPVEGQMYWEIDAKHPGGITGILDPKRLESEDDNQMAMLLTETYLEREGLPVMARHFGNSWRDRLNRDHFYALCMGNSYDLICQGWDPRIVGHWSVVTGSTVMCMEPVGVYHAADPEYAAIDATAVSYMYQRGLDVLAARMMAATVANALHPDATVDSVLQAALDAAPKEKMHTFDERPFHSAYDYISTCLEIADKYNDVLAVRAELYEKCLLYHMIDPLELWGYALAMFKVADGDVRRTAIGGTNIGRDSDTIAGRGAMLAGTLRGAGNVPEEWKQLFTASSLERIKRNAARFADFIVEQKLPRMQQRQVIAGVVVRN